MRSRAGSAESVVLPVPERPKNNITSPFSLAFAAQCMGSTSCSGSRKFCTAKRAFFISPAYFKPANNTRRPAKSIITAASEAVPSRAGSQANVGAFTTFQTGRPATLNAVGDTNSVLANSACQAYSVVTRIGR